MYNAYVLALIFSIKIASSRLVVDYAFLRTDRPVVGLMNVGLITTTAMDSILKKEMHQKIGIDNLELHTINLQAHPMKWLFELEEEVPPPEEHKDQIFPLNKDAANYLWEYETKIKIQNLNPTDHSIFKTLKEFKCGTDQAQELKKWLFNLGMPFHTKVFVSLQPHDGFILTWKMVIKYSSNLFLGYDLILWDKTLNWVLFYHHDDVLRFGKDRIYNADVEGEKLAKDALLIKAWKERNEANKK